MNVDRRLDDRQGNCVQALSVHRVAHLQYRRRAAFSTGQ
jgi:hypothetical protein